MNFHQLTVFVEVAKTKSFSKAADNLYLSQSTVSTHINNLEKDLGNILFDRIGRKAILTPLGKRLFFWAEQILALKNQALDSLYDNESLSGDINISASSVPAQFIVPKIVSNFRNHYPKIKYNVMQSSSKAVTKHLLEGVTDIAFTGEKHYTDNIAYFPLLNEQLVLITPKSIDLSSQVNIESLYNLDMVFRFSGSGTRENIFKVFKNSGLDANLLNIVGYFDNVQSITQCVKEGMASSIVSELALANIDKNYINIYTLKEFQEHQRWFYLAVHKKRTLSKVSKIFIAYIKEQYNSKRKDP
ncbi:selenium metabolism-associated LysR family transcriptional regulator [Proteinivorax tanatarense]|uniref:Selenium metabolism-associated LysR family transcriptional regulator n=1 Tax=Proteinivorax tanatarense TaxID=1260629 RepID=A0AAU7VJ89_9FIRM